MPDGEALALHDLRPEDVETHRLLAAVLAELQAINAKDRRQGPLMIAPQDYTILSALLPVIALAVGDCAFTVRDLIELARQTGETALRDALIAAGGPHRVGHLLKRAAGVEVDGLTVTSIGTDRDGRVWRLWRESPHTRRVA